MKSGVMDKRLLRLPLYPTQAGGEFGSMCFVMCYAGATDTVTLTVFRTRTLNIIMWTGHGIIPLPYLYYWFWFEAEGIGIYLHLVEFGSGIEFAYVFGKLLDVFF